MSKKCLQKKEAQVKKSFTNQAFALFSETKTTVKRQEESFKFILIFPQ